MTTLPHSAQLVVVSSASLQGRTIPIRPGRMTVGRGHTDIHLEENTVSRLHAALTDIDGCINVEDLGSTHGTKVNGLTIREPTPLHHGDTVAFGPVIMRVEESARPSPTDSFSPAVPRGTTFTAGNQHAQQLNMVGGNQYNAYTSAVVARESFMREIAATRTKSRRLVWFGAALFVTGFAAFAGTVMHFIAQGGNGFESGQPDEPIDSPLTVSGLPLGFIGWAVAAVGMFLIVTGIVLHVIATARQRRAEHEWPLHAPSWRGHEPLQQVPPAHER